jgi:hypothetical protein
MIDDIIDKEFCHERRNLLWEEGQKSFAAVHGLLAADKKGYTV